MSAITSSAPSPGCTAPAPSMHSNADLVPELPPPTPPHPPSASLTQRPRERLPVNLILENSGSVARDHLASERTFLAYVRTSLAIASTGVALVQLFTISNSMGSGTLGAAFIPTARRIQEWAQPLGATMVCFGLLVLAVGTTRYFHIQTALVQGRYPVARFTVGSITFILGTIVTIVFAIILSARR